MQEKLEKVSFLQSQIWPYWQCKGESEVLLVSSGSWKFNKVFKTLKLSRAHFNFYLQYLLYIEIMKLSNILFYSLFKEWKAFWLSTMANKVYKSSTHVLILITLPVRLLQQRAGETSQTSQRIIMRKIGFALALIVFTIFIQVRPRRLCNHLSYLLVYQNKPPVFNLQILIFFYHEIGFSFWSAQNRFLFENQNRQKILTL